MKNWKQVEIPELMKNLELDRRGLPVPIIILRDKAGIPHFKMNDDRVVERCIAENRCGVCGNELGDDMWVLGGPKSAFMPQGIYIDSPIHKDCAVYALQVCPYLAVSTYSGKQSNEIMGVFETSLFVNPTQDPNRVPFFVLAKVTGYQVVRRGIERYIIPDRPFVEVELWNDGEKITAEQAQHLVLKQRENAPIQKGS